MAPTTGILYEFVNRHVGIARLPRNRQTPAALFVAGRTNGHSQLTARGLNSNNRAPGEAGILKIARTSSRKPFSNRLAIVGDASCSRYYKNGIESAFITAQIAAETAFFRGVSESAFRAGYYKKIKKLIVRDNFFGRALFKIHEVVYSSAFFTEVLMKVAEDEKKPGRSDHLRDIFWNMYTGNIPYRLILLKFQKRNRKLECSGSTGPYISGYPFSCSRTASLRP